MVCSVDVHAWTCCAVRDQENLAKSTWNLLLDTETTDSDRDGYWGIGRQGEERRGPREDEEFFHLSNSLAYNWELG